MRETTGWFTAHDGLWLFERSWHPEHEPHAVVAILHGGGEHSGRYRHVARRFTAAGFRVDAFDQRSHGRSTRVRGIPLQCDRFEDLLDDTALWLAGRRDDTSIPRVVVGHSMGGLIAVGLATAGRLDADGLVTLGAALRITPAALIEQATAQAGTDLDAVVVPMSRSGFEASTRDPAMTAEVRADPVHADVDGAPAGLLAAAGAYAARIRGDLELVDVPLLAMHGTSDVMADPAATVELAERAASGDKRVELVEDGYHALLRDLDREHTMDTIITWIDERRDPDGRRCRHAL